MGSKYAIPGHINCPTPVIAEIVAAVSGLEVLPTDVTAWFRDGELPGVAKGADPKARSSMTLGQLMDGIDEGVIPPPRFVKNRERKMKREASRGSEVQD